MENFPPFRAAQTFFLFEGSVSPWSYVPVASSMLGVTRILMGTLQIAGGSATALSGHGSALLCKCTNFSESTHVLTQIGRSGQEMVMRGLRNYMRGGAECIPVLGNLSLWALDKNRTQL